MLKILHSSDWHLGRQFHGCSLLEDQKHILDQILQQCVDHKVDLLIVAGDIYDRSVPPAAAVALLDDFIEQLSALNHTQLLMIPGNHDGAVRLGFAAQRLAKAGVHIKSELAQVAEPLRLPLGDEQSLALYCVPYAEPQAVRHTFELEVSTHDQAHGALLEHIKAHWQDNERRILVSHCFVDGALECESERPLAIGGSERVSVTPMLDYDYVALGHLHGAQKRGADTVRYSGSPMPYSFSEQHHNKSCVLLEINADGVQSQQLLPLQPLRNMRVIEGLMSEVIAAAESDPNRDDYLLIRLTDEHAILDAMAKLREAYPNVLHLEKPGMLDANSANAQNQARLKRDELAMFADFYQQVRDVELSDEQRQLIQSTLTRLHNNA
ncbi:exonuclease SbcCD subunit D [Paraferrimonas sedimenticola]|uniref:Nuclease SbcCD subunit D n=1 Tax=Paraferrimonas sedimenticola TaxID=375674 RepID=A0AA37RWS2_9GAMM|nr:exonuclease SbcCD subunit D [Paraferrimonas sedimenticola]GLP96649.1 nuclease SbcCD subunit D [Paraferrimonas sedimenticola]